MLALDIWYIAIYFQLERIWLFENASKLDCKVRNRAEGLCSIFKHYNSGMNEDKELKLQTFSFDIIRYF